jgi:hypothetical protein
MVIIPARLGNSDDLCYSVGVTSVRICPCLKVVFKPSSFGFPYGFQVKIPFLKDMLPVSGPILYEQLF